MNLRLITFICLSLLFCMSTAKPEKCFRKTRTLVHGHYSGKFSEHHFRVRKGKYFNFYYRIFGITKKVDEFSGSFEQVGDTLILKFCGGAIPEGLTGKALIDNGNKKIILLKKDPRYNEEFEFRKDKR